MTEENWRGGPQFKKLDEWLDKHGARLLWEARSSHNKHHTACYSVKHGALVIVVWHTDRSGWGLFTEPNTIDIAETFADAEKRLGL